MISSVLRAARLPFAVLLSAAAAWVSPAAATTTVRLPELTSAEMAGAAKDFGTYCSVCHGADARGQGPVARELKTPPADLTKITARAGGTFPAEVVYKRIEGLDMPLAHGTSAMPVWGAIFVNQAIGDGVLIEDAKTAARVATERMQRLVRYLESIQKE